MVILKRQASMSVLNAVISAPLAMHSSITLVSRVLLRISGPLIFHLAISTENAIAIQATTTRASPSAKNAIIGVPPAMED